MLKKLLNKFILLLTLTFTFSIITYGYEATDLVVDYEGFCPNYPINFAIFNQTQYEDKSDIKDNLCGENETPEKNRCENWEVFDAKVTIFSGPLDGMPVLKEFNLNDQREFQITFSQTNDYLIRIEPTDTVKGDNNTNVEKYNEYEEIIQLNECKFANKNNGNTDSNTNTQTGTNTEQTTKTNVTFAYLSNQIVLDLIETDFEKQTQIQVIDIKTQEKLNNSLQTLKIQTNTESKTFSKIKIQTKINNLPDEIEMFKLDEQTNEWKKLNDEDYKIEGNSVIFTIQTFGTFAVSEKQFKETVIENDTDNNSQTSTDNTNSQTTNQGQTNTGTNLDSQTSKPPIQLDLDKAKESANLSPMMIIGIIIFIVAIAGLMFIPSKAKEHDFTKYHQEKDLAPINESIYRQTKQYVGQYKASYNQEQIKMALEKANIDKNIIEKVLSEEFPKQ